MNIKKGLGIVAVDAVLIAGGAAVINNVTSNPVGNTLPSPTKSPKNNKVYTNTTVKKNNGFTVVLNPAPSNSANSSPSNSPSRTPSSSPSPTVLITPTPSQISSSPSPKVTLTITPIAPIPYPTTSGTSSASWTTGGTPTPIGSRTPTPTGSRTPIPRPTRSESEKEDNNH